MERFEVLDKAGVFKSDDERIEYIDNELGELEGQKNHALEGIAYIEFLKIRLEVLKSRKEHKMNNAANEQEREDINMSFSGDIRVAEDKINNKEFYEAKVAQVESRMVYLNGVKTGIKLRMQTQNDNPVLGDN